MGVKCKLGELRGELQRVRLNLAGCKGVDTLHMRINVYAMRGDRIRKNLLAEPVYFSVPASEADKTTTVDLRPYEIFVRGDFLISVENLTHMPAGAKYWIRARLLARTYTRDTSQAPWKMRKAGVGLSVDVLVEPGIGNRATVSAPAAERPALRSGHPTAAALCGLQIIC